MKKFLNPVMALLLLMPCIKVWAQPANDNFVNATNITSLINTAGTTGGTYTTLSATADQSRASCWSNGPNNNVWFKFTASATGFINAQVKVNGTGETIQNPFVAVYDASLTLLACQNYQGAKVNLNVSYLGMTAGNTYYIVVDNYSGYAGSFDLVLSDAVNYDFKSGALDVTSLINSSCTNGGTYTTQFATPDQTKAICWSNGPNNNVWFKFTASATGFINAQIKVNGPGETMQNPFVAIFDAAGTQLACQNYQGAKVNLNLSYLGLTPGSTYYIAVDNYIGYAGSFDLCLSDVVNYDYKAGAVDMTGMINSSCTTGGTYTTQFATADQSRATCWSNGPNNNVWFKFTATATGFINAKVKVSGAGETMQNPFVAIFDATGTQLNCQNYQGAKTNLDLSYLGLTPGNTYYIAVDNYIGYAGSFDLCVSDVITYDYKVGAVDVTSAIDNSCTTGGTYTTQFATPDQSKGTCWSDGPNNNVWFKFTATSTGFINAKVNVSGTGETMQNPFVAIFDAAGTQLNCQNYQGAKTNLSLSYLGLTPGNTYYIAVDNYIGYYGSFDLCVSDVVNYDYKSGAVDVTGAINSSCTTGGTYTSQFATPDQSKATCWSNGPNNNVWFKFTATSTGFINAKVNVSGTGETMQNPFVALFTAGGTQLACQNYQGAKTNLSLGYLGLTPGNTYYIAVDNYAAYAGSFDLCVSDVVDYDFKQGAKNANAQLNTTTTGGTYSTQFATPDQSRASCWSNGPNNNVWFQFTATPTAALYVNVIVNGTGETMQNPFVAIYNASGTQLACQNYQGAKTNINAQATGLIPGNVYYIAVDNFSGYGGSFDLGVFDNVVTLPLQLTSLTATVNKDRVDVKWTAGDQGPGEIFTVERSKDGMVFEAIGNITGMGNGGYPEQYGMTDYTPLTGTSFYRLKTIDADSNYNYSKTVAVNFGAATGMHFSLYPNPTVTNSTIVLKVGGVTNTTGILIGIYDLQGRQVYLKAAPIQDAGLHSVELSLGGAFVPGIYQVLVTEPAGKQALFQQKLIVL